MTQEPETVITPSRPPLLNRRFILGSLIASLGVNCVLAWRLRSGRRTRTNALFDIGDRVPRLEFNDAAGGVYDIDTGARDFTVLYSLSSSCRWCEKNEPYLRRLSKPSPNFQLIPVTSEQSRQALLEYQLKVRLPIPILRIAPELAGALSLHETPTTMVISREGTIVAVWRGAYDERVWDEIASMLSV